MAPTTLFRHRLAGLQWWIVIGSDSWVDQTSGAFSVAALARVARSLRNNEAAGQPPAARRGDGGSSVGYR